MTNIAPVVSIFHLHYWILSKRLYTVQLLDAFAKHCVTRLFAFYNLSSVCFCTRATIRLPMDGLFFLAEFYVTRFYRNCTSQSVSLKSLKSSKNKKTCVFLCQYIAVHEISARNGAESERPKKHDDPTIILCHTDAGKWGKECEPISVWHYVHFISWSVWSQLTSDMYSGIILFPSSISVILFLLECYGWDSVYVRAR